jgi:DNA-binding GntR family transcriptional regulator
MEAGIESIDHLVGPRGTTEKVVERIRDAIVSGRISPGTWLPETKLAAHLGVSRIPVREALARLEAEGLVKRVPYRGTMVVRLTVDQVIESFMLRSLLEGFAAKLATPHLSPEEIATLRSLVTRLGECARADRHEDLPALHREFHSTIYNKCGSATLIRWINELYNQFPKSLRRTFRFEEPPEECRRIVAAIEAGDAELAGRLMSEHLESGGRVTIKHYAEFLSSKGGKSLS